MIEFCTAFSRALAPDQAARELGAAVEARLEATGGVGGAFLFATAACGGAALEIGSRLAEQWPESSLIGSSFEGILTDGRVWRDEPAVALLAWGQGPQEPLPLVFHPTELGSEHLAQDLLEAAGRSSFEPQDLLLLFPDAIASAGLEAWLLDLASRLGRPSIAGAAASGVGGGACLAWAGAEQQPAATVGLLVPGGAAVADPKVQLAGGSRSASPWLEISACRERWIDGLDGEPPLDWVRRQLGLDDGAPVEPHLDRLLVRIRDRERALGDAADCEALGEAREGFIERYVIGVDDRRGSISVVGGLRRGDQLALALPDAERARDALRGSLELLAPSPLLMQFACRARDETLHGDLDLESALVAHHAEGRLTLGTMSPFQLGPDARGACRMIVHSTVLAALGER